MGSAVRSSIREINMSQTTITHNGRQIDVDAARNLMDDELCEQIHGTVETEQEFFDAYLAAHAEKFGEEFVVA